MLAKALAIAAEAFKDKFDKSGKPYLLHCLYVMNGMDQDNEDEMVIGLLHDLLEDCEEWTVDRLREEGFSMTVCQKLYLLRHDPNTSYMDYIKALSVDPITTRVKKRDLKHNSDITRLKGVRKKDFDRIEKYHTAYVYLTD